MDHVHTTISHGSINRLILVFHRSILIWEKPFSAALLTGLIFLGLTTIGGVPWRVSQVPYYNYLADAILHGQFNLRLLPSNNLDLSFYQGQYYLYWGPLPAFLLMPLVALFGVEFSDVLQTIFLGSVNAAAFAYLLCRANQRGLLQLEPVQRALLIIFFVLGTAQAPLVALGTVWHVSQLVAISFSLLAYTAAVSLDNKKAFIWTGCAMACVLATRPSMIFVAIFLIWYLLHRHWHVGYSRLFKFCIAGVGPVVLIGSLLLLYNVARFGNALDYGYSYHLMGPQFYEMYARYGALNIQYIPYNLYHDFIYYPLVSLRPISVMADNGSLFLLSPLFFAAIFALWQNRKEKATWFLFLTIVIGGIPALMIMAPGSVNFGPRYLLDIATPLLLLTAMGMKRWPTWLVSVCVVISFLHYLIGTLMMVRSWAP